MPPAPRLSSPRRPRLLASLSNFAASLISKSVSSPEPIRSSASTICAPWSLWADAPVATIRQRFLATIPSGLIPQMPFPGPSPNGSILHGPNIQLRQQSPRSPNAQTSCIASNRSQPVSMLASRAFLSTCSAAGSDDPLLLSSVI